MMENTKKKKPETKEEVEKELNEKYLKKGAKQEAIISIVIGVIVFAGSIVFLVLHLLGILKQPTVWNYIGDGALMVVGVSTIIGSISFFYYKNELIKKLAKFNNENNDLNK